MCFLAILIWLQAHYSRSFTARVIALCPRTAEAFMLAGIKVDYSLFVGYWLDLITRGHSHQRSSEGVFVERKPLGDRS